jgi:hypothetical protein
MYNYYADDCMRMLHMLHVLEVIDQRTFLHTGANVWSKVMAHRIKLMYPINGC